MNTKNLGIFFLVIASMLVLMTCVSAAKTDIVTIDQVKINGMELGYNSNEISVDAGDTILMSVEFTALEDATDVRIKAEIEGDEEETEVESPRFTIEEGKRYYKTLSIKVPYELEEKVSDDLGLNLKIYNGDYKTELEEVTLRVQRPTYNLAVMSIEADNSVTAGQTIPVDVVIKNIGYDTVDDLYLTVEAPTLGISKSSYAGDLVSLEDNTDRDDEKDTVRKRFYLNIPYDVDQGIHTIEVTAKNDDVQIKTGKQIYVSNEFSEKVLVTDSKKVVKQGETATYELLIVNPTNRLKVYRVDVDADNNLFTDTDSNLIAIPAGSTKTFKIDAKANTEGSYNFNVNLFSGETLVKTVELELDAESGFNGSSATFVLTVILVVIFIVLLVILIVLLGKKSNKEEEFGESYY